MLSIKNLLNLSGDLIELKFPLSDVEIVFSPNRKQVDSPAYQDAYYMLNQHEFSMEVEGVAYFYASGGNHVQIVPKIGVKKATLELYLNGSVYGAILHQRGVLPLHGSSFIYHGEGILLCGDSGVGKSSLTTAFVLDGHNFLTDDVTPILIQRSKPWIWAMSDQVKLWEDSVEQLNQSWQKLDQIDPDNEKYYFPLSRSETDFFRLDHVFLLEIQEEIKNVCFQDLSGSEKLTALRMEIYRPEYIQGMPENEALFFSQLVSISQQVRMTRVLRPKNIPIQETKAYLVDYLFEKELISTVSMENPPNK
jgi:hypothetical protein